MIGWDMTAALAMAEALSIDRLVAVELLPGIEAAMVEKTNERIKQNG